MLSYIFLLLVVPFVVKADEKNLKLTDGPCPEPPQAMQNLPAGLLSGRWYGRSINHEVKEGAGGDRWRCLIVNLKQQENNVIQAEFRYVNSKGQQSFLRRYKPIADEPGVLEHSSQDESGNWVSNGWHFRVVSVDGDNILQYGCKPFGDQHSNFYRIMSRNRQPNDADREALGRLEQRVRDNGDQRELIAFDQQNCQEQPQQEN